MTKGILRSKQRASFLYKNKLPARKADILLEASQQLESFRKLPQHEMELIQKDMSSVDQDFELLDYCVEHQISQPSRLKAQSKLYVISLEDLEGAYSL